VGSPKALCLQAHFRRILPEAQVEALVAMYSEATEEEVLRGEPDYVLYCIDNIDTKVLFCAVLYCSVLFCSVSYCTVLYWHCIGVYEV